MSFMLSHGQNLSTVWGQKGINFVLMAHLVHFVVETYAGSPWLTLAHLCRFSVDLVQSDFWHSQIKLF